MKAIKKITAAFLAVLMIMSISGCSTKPEWSYKVDDNEMQIGVYIYALYTAYNQAATYASSAEGYDAEKSFLNLTITDDDGETAVAKDWIVDTAKELTKNILTIEEEFEARGLTLTAEDEAAAKESADNDWNLGPYYDMYLAYGMMPTPYKDILEPYGVSYESFERASYMASAKQTALFEEIYINDEETAVSTEDLTNYFTENYTSYSYLSVRLADSATDDSGSTTYTAMSDEDIAEIESTLQGYADNINNGAGTFAEQMVEYTALKELESDPSTSAVENLDESSLNEDVVAALNELEEGKASLVKVGEAENAYYYLIYKAPIADSVADYIEDETNSFNVLSAMKSEEFQDMLTAKAEELGIQENTSVVNSYKPSMFE
ncbi:hypothetical protein B5F08_04085 [Anaeromassilibacillus sp. An172]|uniref:hypothetical protein n=1 Tax=Anaeromassilibacillus sp. An172 TaxID=1965570 RepID=UPI000B398464|nr:hypothetical protein [Anaeromassilibacillus sp. An172]OUP79637.1 hypothetical protein B5F08_04085 [Anaeromassilibacillus sp. An172]